MLCDDGTTARRFYAAAGKNGSIIIIFLRGIALVHPFDNRAISARIYRFNTEALTEPPSLQPPP